MFRRKLWLGLATLVAVQIVMSNLADAIGADDLSYITSRSVLIAFTAAFAGGIVARKGFVVPALGMWLIIWAAIAYVLYQIAEPFGQAPFASILQHNWVAFLLSGAATAVGAFLGQALAVRLYRRPAAT
ncbi:hypothetical protein [Lysobacter sp. A289]